MTSSISLGLTKSAVGKSVARLEERLGFELFHRTTRLTRLTADGEAYFATCSAALDEIASTGAALASGTDVLRGRLHVDMPVAFGRRVLLPILLDIGRPHPGLTLRLTFTDATSDLLQDDVDLAIRFGPLKDSSHLVARLLVRQPRVLCGAPGYLREVGLPRTLVDLRDQRCIVGTPEGPPSSWVFQEKGATKRFTPLVAHQLSDGEAIVDAAVAGLGLCQMPLSLVRDHLARRRLVAVLEELAPPPVDVHAVWPRQAHLSPRVRYFVDQLREVAASGRLD